MKTFTLTIMLVLFLGQTVRAQLRTFKDYRECYTGFINAAGDTVLEPQFTFTKRVSHYTYDRDSVGIKTYWIVHRNKKAGLIDAEGTFVIPMEYQDVSVEMDGAIFLKKKDKYGLIDPARNISIPIEYEWIGRPMFEQFRMVKKEGNKGILNLDGETVVPPDYPDVQYVVSDRNSMNYGTFMNEAFIRFVVTDEFRKKGVYNLKGELEVPFAYMQIHCTWEDPHCESSRIYYTVYKDRNQCGVINKENSVLVPLRYNLVTYSFYRMDTCHTDISAYAFAIDDRGYKAVNLKTGDTTAYYDKIQSRKGLIFYELGAGSGVLDEQFNPLIHFDEGIIAMDPSGSQPISNGSDTYALRPGRFHQRDVLKDSLMYHIKKEVYEKNMFGKYVLKEAGKKEIFNLYTGKSTGMDNNLIVLKKSKGKTRYWGIDINDGSSKDFSNNLLSRCSEEVKTEELYKIRIYDDQYELIRTVPFLCRLNGNLFYSYNTEQEDTFIYVLSKQDHSIGAIDEDGEVVIPFEFDKYRAVKVLAVNKYEVYHAFGKNGKMGLYDIRGRQHLPHQYDLIYENNGSLKAMIGDTIFIFNHHFELVKTEFPKVDPLVVPREEIKLEEPKFVEIDHHLFLQNKDTLIAIDSTKSRFRMHFMTYDNKYLVNRSGEIIHYGNFDIEGIVDDICIVRLQNEIWLLRSDEKIIKKISTNGTYRIITNVLLIRDSIGVGVVDPHTGDFIIPPGKYEMIMPVYKNGRRDEVMYWVLKPPDIPENISRRKRKRRREQWEQNREYLLLNSSAEVSTPFVFYRIPHGDNAHLIKQGNRCFILDENKEVNLPKAYPYIRHAGSGFAVYEDGKWGLYSRGKFSGIKYDAIDLRYYRNGFLVFRNDEAKVLDFELNELLPWTKIETIYDSLDLGEILGEMIEGQWYHFKYLPKPTKENCNQREANNLKILGDAELLSTRQLFIRPNLLVLKNDASVNVYDKYQHNEVHVYPSPLYCSPHFYSEAVQIDSVVVKNYERSGFTSRYWRNYRFENQRYTQVSLEDLLIDGKKSIPALDKLIGDEITRIQAYGPNCVNLNERIEELRPRMLIGEHGLLFCEVSSRIDTITIPYDQLKHLLKDPVLFGIE